MNVARTAAVAIFVGLIPALASAQTRSMTVLLPGGTAIPVHLVSALSSGSVKPGDTFAVQASQDVSVSGMVVVRNGAAGQGTIGEVDHAGGNGHSGSLVMNFDYVYAVDGGKIRLSNTAQKQAEEDRKGASSTATIIGFATFGLGGLFGHNLAHGREVTIDPNKQLSAFVLDSVHVQTAQRATEDHYDR